MVIIVNRSKTNYLWMGFGEGTNTIAELLERWGLLLFSFNNNIISLQVASDSNVIVDWAAKKHNLQVDLLEQWKQRVVNFKTYLILFPSGMSTSNTI